MQDLSTQEDRQQFLEDYLSKTHIGDEEEVITNESQDGEQLEEEIETLPNNLATPISLQQKEKTQEQAEKKKKKKKKKKSKTANLPDAGTELADDYVEKDTEDVVENPFDPERPLSHRVEYAIWKYRKNHKFSDEKKAIFDNYLKFGGIQTGPNMFLGRATSADAPDDPDAAIDFEALKTSIDTVPDEEEEGVEVNFTEVAQVYFGNTFIRESRFISLQDFIDAPKLIDAFLRYLQIRSVAPEYAQDIAGARAICEQAKVQLPMCKQASLLLPGEYNKACATVFGALQSDMDTSWMTESTMKVQKQFMSFIVDTLGSNVEEAKETVKKHIKHPDQVQHVETREWVFVKIAEIAPHDKEDDELVQVVLNNNEDTQENYNVYLEKRIVQHLMVGFVMRVTISKLTNGEWYLDSATRIMPTFFMEDDCMGEEDYDF